MAGLTQKKIKDSYKSLLRVDDDTHGIDGSLADITDGEGTTGPFQISSTEVAFPSSSTLKVGTIKANAATEGFHLNLTDSNTNNLNLLSIPNNLDGAFIIQEGGNQYMKFATSNGGEKIEFVKDVEMQGNLQVNGTIVGSSIDFNSVDMDNVDIDSGTIDGTTIGASSASTGAFTTLTASDAVTFAKSTNGDYKAKIYNANAGTATESNIYITNSSSDADGLFAGVGGTGFTTAGGFVQDGAWIGSGTGASGGLSLMTRASADMRFYTNGHTNLAMVIDSSQRVGIGTTSPDANSDLNIEGSGYKTLLVNTSFSGGGGLIVEQGGTQSAVYGTGGSTWLSGSATTDALIRAEQNLIIATGGNTRAVTIDSSQRVGIGTTNPTIPLVVGANGDPTQATIAAFINTNDGGVASIMIQNDAGGGSTDETNEIVSRTSNRRNGKIVFGREADQSSTANADSFLELYTATNNVNNVALHIDSSQRVGIGTDNPDTKLVVAGAFQGNASDAILNTQGIHIDDTTTWSNLHSSKPTGGGINFSGVYNSSNDQIVFAGIRGIKENTTDGNYDGALVLGTIANGGNMTQRMRITSDGKVGIGETSPGATLHVKQADSGASVHSSADQLAIENSSNAGLSILSGNTGEGAIYFGDVNDNNVGRVRYDHSANSLDFFTNASEKMRITSAGNIKFSTDDISISMDTSSGSDDKVMFIGGGGNATSVSRGALIALAGVNDTGLDGQLRLYAGNASNNNGHIQFHVANGSKKAELNYNGDFYTNDGTVSSLASDVRVKDNITDLSDGLSIINQLRPVTFRYTDDSEFHEAHDLLVTHYGFIADEVKEVAPQYTQEGKGKVGEEEVDDFKTLSMLKMFPMLVKAVQELSAKVEALENA